VFQGFFDGALRSKGALVVVDRRDGRMIGSSRYHDLKIEESQVEIGYTFLTRKYWGGSFNRELKTLMLDHAFRFVDVVVFVVGEANVRSRRAMEKIGGELIGNQDRPGPDGKLRKNVVYRIRRP
jgi:RimJ/RimL family protein N-acetyltransferase